MQSQLVEFYKAPLHLVDFSAAIGSPLEIQQLAGHWCLATIASPRDVGPHRAQGWGRLEDSSNNYLIFSSIQINSKW